VVLGFTAFGEVLARDSNRVTLSRRKDAWGMPAPQIELAYGPNERAMIRDCKQTLVAAAQGLGPKIIHRLPRVERPGTSIHEVVGGAPMGTDPRHSVLTPFGQIWDVPNAFVVDGAAFVSSPCQNPTLTMMALADSRQRSPPWTRRRWP
jgi:choline dehydrogenase-like flavoprotein